MKATDQANPVAEKYAIDLGKSGTHIVGVGSCFDIDKMIKKNNYGLQKKD